MNYQNLTDKDLIDLIFKMEDLLETDYLDEIKKRRETVIPLLCNIAKEEKHYQLADSRGWGVIHAVYLLGILGDEQSIDAFFAATKFANKYEIDWIWDALPECYLRIGPTAIPALKSFIEKDYANTEMTVSSEITGLWNIWDVYPDTKKDIEDFLLGVIKSARENYELRTNLIGDFAQINRHDLRPLFEEYYENGEVDLDTLTRSDLDDFYENVNDPPGFRFDLEAFYSPEEIAKRQKRWEEEDQKREYNDIEELILENIGRIGRNESCPCGSGQKFKKCHLKWAEEEQDKMRQERIIREESILAGRPIFQERHYETILRRYLASKGKISMFSDIKSKILEVLKLPQVEYQDHGPLTYLTPFLKQLEFKNKTELKEFLDNWTEYHNALAEQYIGHPRNDKKLH